MQLLMSNIQNKIKHFVNFIKHKKEHVVISHYTHSGIHLHLYQNNITYHSTSKNITEIIFTTTQIQMENKTIYQSTNK